MTKKIFIITVNYNSADKVENLIKSLDIPIIIIDNASVDDDREEIRSLAKKAKNITLIENPTNLGFARGINVGIKKALKMGAEMIVLVNPDLNISASQIGRLADSEADITGPILTFERNGQRIYDLGGKVNWIIGRTTHVEVLGKDTLRSINSSIDYVSGACMAIKKDVLEKIGSFDERFFMYLEDVDFCLRAKLAGFKVGVNREVVVEHQIKEHRKSQNPAKIKYNLKSNFLFIRKWTPVYFQPLALAYYLFFAAKVLFNQSRR